ncbi:MAG: glycine--tRNA ligase [Candidatus Aenigmatarchaeota archaeon]
MGAEKILDIAKRRGFFWQSSLVHGSVAGFWDYAHVGSMLKRKFEDAWRRFYIGLDDNFYEIEPAVIMPENVFKASGHLEHFIDPVVKCKKCGAVERADHILEDVLHEKFEGLTPEELMKLIKKHRIKCGTCKGELAEVGVFNMLLPLKVGAGEATQQAYLTGETAQGAYVNFKLEFEALRRRLPLGLAVIGRAFRNEIAPRNVLMRMREFSQAELQIFFDPDAIKEHSSFREVERAKLRVLPVKGRKKGIIEVGARDAVKKLGLPRFYTYYMAKVQEFYLGLLGLSPERFRFKELSKEERAFYNRYHWDVEVNTESFGWVEVGGVHYRTDHDLSGHQKVSGQSMAVNIEGKSFVPHVLELSFGVDRNVFCLLDLACTEEKERTVLRFPRLVSPYDAGVFPLVNKDGLPEKARGVKELLQDSGFTVFFDASGSIGRRYRRMDEIGCAAGITIDYDSLKKKDCTLRDRDSMAQVRVKIADLPEVLRRFLQGEGLKKLGRPLKRTG